MIILGVSIIILGALIFPLCGILEADIDLLSGTAAIGVRAYGMAFRKHITALDTLLKKFKINETNENTQETKTTLKNSANKINNKRALFAGGRELVKAVRIPRLYFRSSTASDNPILAAYASATARVIYCSVSAILKEKYATKINGDFTFETLGTELGAFAAISVETNAISLIIYGISSIIKYIGRRNYEKRKRGYRRGKRA